MSRLRHALTVDDWMLHLVDPASAAQWTLHPDRRSRYWADPFFLPEADGSFSLLCEEFDYATNQGTIVHLTLGPDRAVREVEPILRTGHHESYPFTFTHEGDQFCVPEIATTGEVRLYQRDGDEWHQRGVLLEGFAGLDSTLHVGSDGRLWLFSSPVDNPDALHVWYAEQLDGPWRPHARNPVLVSPRGGRSAGRILELDGELRRPGQNAAQRYGRSVVICRIEDLTPSTYAEREVEEMLPPAGFDGMHTLDRLGELVLTDVVHRRPVLADKSYVRWRVRKTLASARQRR